jgi:fimbrial chaperone protein
MKSIYLFSLLAPIFVASSSLAFSVSPVKINLDRESNSQDIEIANDNPTEKLRVQVDSYKWQQNAQGASILEPTREIVAFPSILEIPANSKRTIRVGVRVPHGITEKTYRVIVKQLKDPALGVTPVGQQTKSQLSFLVNMSLPVYVEPIKTSRTAELSHGKLKQDKLVFTLSNTGNVRVELGEASFNALTATGEILSSTKIKLGNILANVKREFVLDLPKSQCEKIRSIAIDATAPLAGGRRMDNLKTTISTPNGVCNQEIGKK